MSNIFLAKGAFHGNPDFKAEAEVSMKEHRAKDRILRASYLIHRDTFGNWDYGHALVDSVSDESYASIDFRGCALGCMLHDYLDVKSVRELLRDGGGWHKMTQKVFGIPELLACAIDDFFENRLTFEDAAEAAVAIVEAIPVGADYTEMVNCDHTNCEDIGCDDDHNCLDCKYSKLTLGSLEQFLNFLRSAPIVEA